MKKRKEIISVLFYATAVLMFIVCIRNFLRGDTDRGVLCMCLASSNMCCGALWMDKCKREKEDENS